MLTEGYCHLHRKILKHFTKPYSEINAWIWLITQAEWRNGDSYGKVVTTTRQLGLDWGVNKATASRWLHKWISDGRIVCKFAKFKGATMTATIRATSVSEITLVNYEAYQVPAGKGATIRATTSAPLLNTKKEVLKKEKDKNLSPKKVSPPVRLPKKLQIELLKSGLLKDQEKYPDINVPREFEKWQNWMEATGKYPKGNYAASWRNRLILAEEFRLERLSKNKPNGLSSTKRKEFGLD